MKNFKKTFIAVVLSAVFVSAALGFSGCAITSPDAPTPKPNLPDDPPVSEDPPIVESDLTLNDFLSTNSHQAVLFVNDFIKKKVYGNKEVLSEEITISANEDNDLDGVHLAYIYKIDSTARAFNIAHVTLDPIDLDKIADQEVTENDVEMTVDEQNVLTFDAKENYLNQDVAQKLKTALTDFFDVSFSDDNFEAFVYNDDVRNYSFSILDIDSNGAKVYDLGVLKSLEPSKEDLFDRISNDYFITEYNVHEYSFDGVNIYSRIYQQEKFDNGHENPPIDEKVESIDQLFNEYSNEVNAGLEAGYENIIKNVIPNNILGFDANQLKDSSWNFDCNSAGEISKINFVTTYHRERNMQTLIISSISLQNPINIKNLNKKDISSEFSRAAQTGSYKYEYSFTYDSTIQAENQQLADAIFTAEGKNVDGAEKFIYQNSTMTDSNFGEVKHFTVIQISDKGINELRFIVKTSSSKEGLIKNIENGLYKITNTNEYKLGNYNIIQENATLLDYDYYNL